MNKNSWVSIDVRDIKFTMLSHWVIVLFLLLLPKMGVVAQGGDSTPTTPVTGLISAYDLIAMENATRAANGLSSLKVDENIMKCAQNTAEIMAAYNMSGHIGNVRDRISSFGYNNYYQSWATENFMMGDPGTTLSKIREIWGDAPHLASAINPLYCHIGAGVAEASDGTIYFVLQAAYPAYKPGCGYVDPKVAEANNLIKIPKSSGGVFDTSNVILAVQTAQPNEKGEVYHVLRQGQTLWHVADAYGTTIEAIAAWNQMKTTDMLQVGEKLRIPLGNLEIDQPTLMPTVLATMSADGKFRHTIKEGETLWSIAELWGADLSAMLNLNGLTEDSTLRIDWKLFIPVTPTVSPMPTNTPLASPSPTSTAEQTATLTRTVIPADQANKSSSQSIQKHVKRIKITLFFLIGVILALMLIIRRKS